MSAVSSFFSQLWRIINGTRKVIINLVFFFILGAVIISISQEEEPITVPENAILVLNPTGVIVEEMTYVDPIDQAINEAFGSQPENPEVLLSDLLDAIERAKTDTNIGAIYLSLEGLYGGGLNKLQAVGRALEDFKTSGKPVIAAADYFTQAQYYLAAHADKVYLNPLGGVDLSGYGNYQLYFKDMLAKLKVSTHVFKAGSYKSAVEPYTRNDMSDEAKEANKVLYDELWNQFKADISAQRELSADLLSGDADRFMALYDAANGDSAQFALNTGLVDELRTREALRSELINLAGYDEEEESYRRINFSRYLDASAPLPVIGKKPAANQIAVIQARGVIVDGFQKPGMIGGDSTAERLRDARLNENTKAVVLRIDSPGGSGFASEIIRQEVLQLQQAGIPVVASMSSVAASGGYWIAASADEIWAAPTTITGSIGVFGMFFTVEESLAALGINSDGYATTEYPRLDITRALPEREKALLQSSVEKFYRDFVQMVADARGMSFEAVDKVAQGRVWTGIQAQQFGLVDQLGTFEDAIAAAARLANLEEYEVTTVEPEKSAREIFMAELFGESLSLFAPSTTQPASMVERTAARVWRELSIIEQFNDPNGIYLLCDVCPTE